MAKLATNAVVFKFRELVANFVSVELEFLSKVLFHRLCRLKETLVSLQKISYWPWVLLLTQKQILWLPFFWVEIYKRFRMRHCGWRYHKNIFSAIFI